VAPRASKLLNVSGAYSVPYTKLLMVSLNAAHSVRLGEFIFLATGLNYSMVFNEQSSLLHAFFNGFQSAV
jgi:hypothetical protein